MFPLQRVISLIVQWIVALPYPRLHNDVSATSGPGVTIISNNTRSYLDLACLTQKINWVSFGRCFDTSLCNGGRWWRAEWSWQFTDKLDANLWSVDGDRPAWQFTDKLDAKYWEVSVKSPIDHRMVRPKHTYTRHDPDTEIAPLCVEWWGACWDNKYKTRGDYVTYYHDIIHCMCQRGYCL